MLSPADAAARILEGLVAVPAETVPLTRAAGRVLARPVHARLDHPAHDVSAMDGYAINGDPIGNGPLVVIGEAAAGHPSAARVEAGQAMRIFTGGVMPDGADRVLIQENATRDENRLVATDGVAARRHVRPRAGDFARDAVLLAPGHPLSARAIGLAAAAGHPFLVVHRRPRVALLATGDELVLPGEPIPPGGLPNSNTFALAAIVRAAGAEPVLLPIAPDRVEAIAGVAEGALDCDLLVTIGGASVGDHDLVRAGLALHGFAPEFWRIAMRPGKPLMHGHVPRAPRPLPVLGLPGNPVSAIVCACLFLVPAIARLAGRAEPRPRRHHARLTASLPANDHRADHLRASVSGTASGLEATPLGVQDSARLADLVHADALLLRAPHAPAAVPGDPVELLLLAELGA